MDAGVIGYGTPASATGAAVGFDGLGGVGWALASSLARAGHALVVHDDDAARARAFAQEFQCRAANDLAGLSASGLLLFAPPGFAVRERIASVSQGLHAGAIVVDLGAADPTLTRSLGARLAQRGIVLIDAPLCGDAQDSAAAAIVHGCDDDSALDVALPVLRTLGLELVAGGALGCGQALRLVEAHVHADVLAASAEALLVGDRIGLAPAGLRARIAAAIRRGAEREALEQAGSSGQGFATGLALGLFAQSRAGQLAAPSSAPGLTRLLIEFTTPANDKETVP